MEGVHHGELLKKHLREKDVKLTDLSKKLKISRASVYYLFGRRNIDSEMLDKLKRLTGFTIQHTNGLSTMPEPEPEFKPDYIMEPELKKAMIYFKFLIDELKATLESRDNSLRLMEDTIKAKDETIQAQKDHIDLLKSDLILKKPFE